MVKEQVQGKAGARGIVQYSKGKRRGARMSRLKWLKFRVRVKALR